MHWNSQLYAKVPKVTFLLKSNAKTCYTVFMDAKKIIKEAAYALISKKRIEDVTLKEILEASTLSKQTFYRYYDDKYAMSNELYDELFVKPFYTLSGALNSATWKQVYFRQFQAYRTHLAFAQHVFSSRETGCATEHEIASVIAFDRKWIARRGGNPDDPLLDFAIQAKDVGGTFAMRDWILSGMKTSDSDMVYFFSRIIPEVLQQFYV